MKVRDDGEQTLKKAEVEPERAEVQADRQTARVDEANQRRKYGGFNFGAAFFGWLVAIGVAVLLTALLAAAGSAVALTSIKTTSQLTQQASTVGLVGGILLLVDLALAYYAGGYVAGRMSRFDGARQGFGVWIIGLFITVVIGLIGAIFGSKYNVLQQINLPHIPLSKESFTKGGLITSLLTVLVTVISAVLGGKVGERYHRKIDRAGGLNR